MQLEELWQIIWNAENLKLTWQCSFFYWFTGLKKEKKKTIVEECFHFLTIHRAQQKSEKLISIITAFLAEQINQEKNVKDHTSHRI